MPFFLAPLLLQGAMAVLRPLVVNIARRYFTKGVGGLARSAVSGGKTLGRVGLKGVRGLSKRLGGRSLKGRVIKELVKGKLMSEIFGGGDEKEDAAEAAQSTADLGDGMMVSANDSPGNVYNMNLQPYAEALEDNSVVAWSSSGKSIAASLLPRYGEGDNKEIIQRLDAIENAILKQNEVIKDTSERIDEMNEMIRRTELQDKRDADEADQEKDSLSNRFLGRVKDAAGIAGLAALNNTGVLSAVGSLGAGLAAFAGAGLTAGVAKGASNLLGFGDEPDPEKDAEKFGEDFEKDVIIKAREERNEFVKEQAENPTIWGFIKDVVTNKSATDYDPNEGTEFEGTTYKGPDGATRFGTAPKRKDLGDATKLETVQLTKVHQNNYIRHIRTIENVNQEIINIHKEYGMPQTNPDELDVNVTADDDNGIQNISVQVEREGGVRFYRMNKIDEKYFTLIRKKIVAEELADQSLRKIEKIKIDSGEIVPDENWNRQGRTISTVTDPTDENAIPRTVVTNTASSSDEYRAMIARSLVPGTNLHDISNFSDVGQLPTGRDMGASIRRQGVGVLETGLVQPDIKPDEMSIWDRIKGMLPSLVQPVVVNGGGNKSRTPYHDPVGQQPQASLRASPPVRANDRFNISEAHT